MRIRIDQVDGIAVVGIEGELRLASVAEARPQLVALADTGGDVRLDLSALDECDTAGVQLLLMACASVRAKGRRVAMAGPAIAFHAALGRIGIPVESFGLPTPAVAKGREHGVAG